MQAALALTPKELIQFLLHVAVVRPVSIFGQPGIGKTALVGEFAKMVGMELVSLLGSQLAPEDLIGVPTVSNGMSRFNPPEMLVRDEPYVLFIDELNGASKEVQRAFYSIILEQRIGSYTLPKGSVVILAGNRVQDGAIVKPMGTALINRLVHVQLISSPDEWLEWAYEKQIHPWVTDYIKAQPGHLTSPPPKGKEEPFSAPRSWHYLSDTLYSFGEKITDRQVQSVAQGTLTPKHASQFRAFVKKVRLNFDINAIIAGDQSWPRGEENRDVLYFLVTSFRHQLIKLLPEEKGDQEHVKKLAHRAKALTAELADTDYEMAALVVGEDDDGRRIPAWLLLEIVRDLPRLASVVKRS